MASDSGSGQNDSAFYKWWSGYNEPFPRPKTTAKAAWFAALASAPAHSSGNGQAFKAGDEVWVRGKLVAPANEHGRIEVVCDTDEQFYVNPGDVLASAPAVDRAGEAVLPSDRERAMLFYGYPIDATAIAMTAMANILRLAEQFAQVRSHSRAGVLKEALATEFDAIGPTEMDAITPEFAAPADAGKELRALSAKWHGPIGDGGKGWADEDKIYWCREVRNQCAEELDAVLALLSEGEKT